MTDIVERLRAHPGPEDSVTVQFRTMVEQRHEAADEIERLRDQWELAAAMSEKAHKEIERLQGVVHTLETDIRWAVNVLLEKIAVRFEENDTWKSDAAALVRSFKHKAIEQAHEINREPAA